MEIDSDDIFRKVILEHLSNIGIDIENPEELKNAINDFMLNELKPTAALLLKEIKRDAKKRIKRKRKHEAGFNKRLNKRWYESLYHLDIFIQQCLAEGDDFNKRFGEKAAKENDYLFVVLKLLHARSCQVASEILVLLRNGYSDGAHARWRTLHEIDIISMFIADHGQELAEKYFHYEIVETYKEALEYQKNCELLDYEPLSEEEFNNIKKEKDEIAKKYGKEFLESYGWTANILPKGRRNFKSIEDAVKMGHMHSWYKLACNNIHAGPKSIRFRLSLPEYAQEALALAGPTDYGLADPGQSCAISLNRVTTTLLLSKPSYDRILVTAALLLYAEEICTSFVRTQKTEFSL